MEKRALARVLVLSCFMVSMLAAPVGSAERFSDIYVFGDSLSDSGNISLFTQGAIPGGAYYEGRFSNGPNYADLVASELGFELTPSLAGGDNYAFGGAMTSSHARGLPFNLLFQVEDFLGFGKAVHPEALFIVFIGANDVQEAVERASQDPENAQSIGADRVETSVGDIAAALFSLESTGARRVLVPNLPDIARTPALKEMDQFWPEASSFAASLTRSFNDALDEMLDTFPDLEITRFDIFSVYEAIIRDPSSYGFTDVASPCLTGSQVCDAPESHLFWDDFHPTAAGHEILAEGVLEAVGGEGGGQQSCATVGGAEAGDSVEAVLDPAQCEAFTLLLDRRVEAEKSGTRGRIYVGLEAPDALPGLVFFRPGDVEAPPYVVLARSNAAFTPGAAGGYFSEGVLSSTAEDLEFVVGGLNGLTGGTLVFTTWSLQAGQALSEDNLDRIQKVSVSVSGE